jgi:hypothetical protein
MAIAPASSRRSSQRQQQLRLWTQHSRQHFSTATSRQVIGVQHIAMLAKYPLAQRLLTYSRLRAVLKVEETVKKFLMDASQATLEFPPSTANYQVSAVHVLYSKHPLLQQLALYQEGAC